MSDTQKEPPNYRRPTSCSDCKHSAKVDMNAHHELIYGCVKFGKQIGTSAWLAYKVCDAIEEKPEAILCTAP